MPSFAVFMNASNLLINMDGEVAKCGFFVTRVVIANDASAAEEAAVQSLRGDQDLRSIILNAHQDPPVMYVREIKQVEAVPERQQGRVWYKMESSDD